ncbi:MAG: hypothetical protein KDD34_09765 [Bdellovibrionales bacterium]|nr:hypothetical protein [Bdellovibrionales bacterium]
MRIKYKLGFKWLSFLGIFSALVLGSASEAQQNKKRKATIDFEDELIEGEVKKPEFIWLMQKKQFNFKKLIKLRNDFLPEMRRTSEELRHTGSKD